MKELKKLTLEEIEKIRKDPYKADWFTICFEKKLSEDFIKEFYDKVDWIYISWYQKLSESFIREFSDKLYWPYISQYQKLSEEFIYEFYDKVDWEALCDKKEYNFKDSPRHIKLYIALKHRDLLGDFNEL